VESESQVDIPNMLNNYMKAGLIYGVRNHSINQDLGVGKKQEWEYQKCKWKHSKQCVHEKGSTGRQVGEGTRNKT